MTSRILLLGATMFVVSVLDNDQQRTFVSENLKILDRIVYATIRGKVREFSLLDVLDIVPIESKTVQPRREPAMPASFHAEAACF